MKDLLQEAIETALEDLAIHRAIKKGEKSKTVKKEEVFKILQGKA